jgi:hypothetical protein
MAEQCIPTLVQNSTTNEWYIVTSWHKKDHPKTKYNVTPQMHHVIGNAIEQFVKHIEAEAKKQAAELPPETEDSPCKD